MWVWAFFIQCWFDLWFGMRTGWKKSWEYSLLSRTFIFVETIWSEGCWPLPAIVVPLKAIFGNRRHLYHSTSFLFCDPPLILILLQCRCLTHCHSLMWCVIKTWNPQGPLLQKFSVIHLMPESLSITRYYSTGHRSYPVFVLWIQNSLVSDTASCIHGDTLHQENPYRYGCTYTRVKRISSAISTGIVLDGEIHTGWIIFSRKQKIEEYIVVSISPEG